jgi:hypothetical protein
LRSDPVSAPTKTVDGKHRGNSAFYSNVCNNGLPLKRLSLLRTRRHTVQPRWAVIPDAYFGELAEIEA